MLRSTKRVVFLSLGLIAVGLGFLGVFLPLLPTTPFLLLAAFLFSKSSERLHDWLLNHRIFGKFIRDWREHRAIAPRAKVLSVAMIVPLYSYTIFFHDFHIAIKIVLGAMAIWSIAFILTRNNGPRKEAIDVSVAPAEPANG
ncbi:MAG: DUF454 domain-containing protein [Acidobacteria bacterium]|nr:MAG: DUF454 domain-containing protein [Acidobacteriota bacterium]REJ98937.1 MAG: DUF454 domain-containing protein [Acidobacteriota bacterium]REK16343.1 MAG: DUF454 domain-containing protein [Acidobacteriota bacterium]REK44024.1 MAG: DUF454 domain-containing protein [Acidobacteriota bacterium]